MKAVLLDIISIFSLSPTEADCEQIPTRHHGPDHLWVGGEGGEAAGSGPGWQGRGLYAG